VRPGHPRSRGSCGRPTAFDFAVRSFSKSLHAIRQRHPKRRVAKNAPKDRSMTNATFTPLEALVAKQAITEVLYRYARACDRADESLMRGCFHPGSLHRHGRFQGTSTEFVTVAMKIIRTAQMTKHLITNPLIEFAGDAALSECHYLAYHRIRNAETDSGEDNFSGGRYLDRFERRGGEWKIVERVGLLDFERFDPPAERDFAKLLPMQRSRRFPEDDLYARFLPGGQPPAVA
jgi:SnoaL-like protein